MVSATSSDRFFRDIVGSMRNGVIAITRDGRIPTVRLGRYYRYRLAAVEAWERQSEGLTAA